jgi:hypothetical protein
MPIDKQTLQKLAIVAKVKLEDLEAAQTAKEDTAVAIPEKLSSYTDDEVQTLKTNEYNSGKVAGVEMAVKDTKEKMGLNFSGKTIDGLLEAATKKALDEAKIQPDKQVQELQEKVTNLQNTVKGYETKMAEKDVEVSGMRINGELYKHIPAPGDNGPALSQDNIIQLMKGDGYEFKQDNGIVAAYKSGKQLQDKLSNPLPVKDVITEFLKEKKLVTEEGTPGGRGGDDKKPPVKATKLSELKKNFTDQGKSLLGEEFSQAVTQAVKDNKDFDLKS